MARPRSDEKREAILEAAAALIAKRGLTATPTSAISKAAGVAEGTLFTYFPSKTELINALYAAIKQDMVESMMPDLPSGDVRTVFEQVWHGYIQWGLQHPAQRVALQQVERCGLLAEESLAASSAPFAPLARILHEAQRAGVFGELTTEQVTTAVTALAEATALLIAKHGSRASRRLRMQGFEMLWRAITP